LGSLRLQWEATPRPDLEERIEDLELLVADQLRWRDELAAQRSAAEGRATPIRVDLPAEELSRIESHMETLRKERSHLRLLWNLGPAPHLQQRIDDVERILEDQRQWRDQLLVDHRAVGDVAVPAAMSNEEEARFRLEEARRALEEFLSAPPDAARARALLERVAGFVPDSLRQELGQRLAQENFLPEECAAWAREALLSLGGTPPSLPPPPAVEVPAANFGSPEFPLFQGLWHRYRRLGRANGMEDSVEIESVSAEAGMTHARVRVETALDRWNFLISSYTLDCDGTEISRSSEGRKEVFLRTPAAAETEIWAAQLGDLRLQRRIVSASETVTVPYGTFHNCVVVEFASSVDVRSDRKSVSSRSVYAPGIGLILLEYADPDFESFGLELVDTNAESPLRRR